MPSLLGRTALKQLRLLVVAVVPLLRLSAGAETCNLDVPTGAWANGAAYTASMFKPKFTVPPIGAGFNRTLDLDGFCTNLLYASDTFTCKKDALGELQLNVKEHNGVFLRFASANCPLSAVVVKKTAPGSAFAAELRFQFEFCTADTGFPPAPVSSAAIVIGLKEGASKLESASVLEGVGRNLNLMPWLSEACGLEKEESSTPAPVASTLVLSVQTTSSFTGNTTCKAASGDDASLQANLTAADEAACREQCSTAITKAHNNKDTKEKCTGFSYQAATKSCKLYQGTIDSGKTAEEKGATGIVCFTMSMLDQDKAEVTTTAPKSAIESDIEKQTLHVREVFGGAPEFMKTAKVMGVWAPTYAPQCFVGTWWFTLEDEAGNAASIDVLKENWVKLMDLLPDYKASSTELDGAKVEIDRVLVKGCNAGSTVSWGRDCVMPVAKTVCDNKQLINAVITGVVAALGSCWIVKLVHSIAGGPARDPDFSTYDDKGEHPQMPLSLTAILCVVAILASAALAVGCSSLVNVCFGLSGCLHGSREVLVVSCACGLATSISLVVALLYLHFSHKEVQKQVNPEPLLPAGVKQSKLMLVESNDGGRTGRPVNPDIMTSGVSAMNTYSGPQSLAIE